MTRTIRSGMLALPLVAAIGCGQAPPGVNASAAAASASASAPTSAAASAAAGASGGAAQAPAVRTVTGAVLETMNSGGYTYVRLQSGGEDIWIAADEFATKAGERLTVPLESPMQNFESRTLQRTFPLIYFVSQVSREGAVVTPSGLPRIEPMTSRQGVALPSGPAVSAPAGPVEPIAPPSGGMTIADVWTKRSSLAGKAVTIRGRVMKFNSNIMDRNWVHLQDGSGSPSDGTHDLAVTTAAEVKIGDVVTASGTLATKKDFGAGYAYEAILEQATLK